jgi:cytochrome c2
MGILNVAVNMFKLRSAFNSESIWHVVSVLAILILPSLILLGRPFWNLPGDNPAVIAGVATGYVLAAIAAKLLSRFSPYATLPALVLALSFGFVVVYFLFLLIPISYYSRLLLLGGSLLAAICLLMSPLALRLGPTRMTLLAIAFAAVIAATFVLIPRDNRTGDSAAADVSSSKVLAAGQQILTATYYPGRFAEYEQDGPTGGAITRDPTMGYVLAASSGNLYRFSWNDEESIAIERLPIKAPINRDEFIEDYGEHAAYATFRLADVAIQENEDGHRLYVSHHYWNRKDRCVVVRISSRAWPGAVQGSADDGPEDWRTVFESQPCLPIGVARGSEFAGEQIGGNLEFLDSRFLLATIGDHQFDGWYRPTNYVQDIHADYGKTILIDTLTGESSIYTLGHRNPQGLTIDASGRVWSTEHGPEGGDELNLLVRGGNYGYPKHTYGTDYGSVTWPPGVQAGAIDNEQRPIFAWVPSIGISEIVAVSDPGFENWRGDLLVSSLRGKAIWRIRLDGDRIAYAESIAIGERIRDLVQGDGEFVLWTDSGALVRLQPAKTLNDGAALFTLHCGGCHDDNVNRIGPHLRDIVGRPVASAKGYNYSAALRAVDGEWTEDSLLEFLRDPAEFAPGTKMAITAELDEAQHAMIIEYLKYAD